MKTTLYNLEVFKGKNFQQWKFRLEQILDENECLNVVREKVENKTRDYEKREKRAKSIIVQYVSVEILDIIMDKENAFEMWQTLKEMYETKGIAGCLKLSS